jgi:hypothetical protein
MGEPSSGKPAFSDSLRHDRTVRYETRKITAQNLQFSMSGTASGIVKTAGSAAAGVVRIGARGAKGLLHADSGSLVGDSKRNDMAVKAGSHLKDGSVATVRTTARTARRTVRTARKTARAVKKTVDTAQKVARTTVKTVKKAVEVTVELVKATIELLVAMFSNPVTAVVALVLIVVIICMLLITPASMKPTDIFGEILDLQLRAYLLSKDLETEMKFRNTYPSLVPKPMVTHTIVGTSRTNYRIMSAYLVAKLDATGLDFFTGCAAIDEIHGFLYTITIIRTRVILTGLTIRSFLESHYEEFLTEDQKGYFDLLLEFDQLLGTDGFGPPFEDPDFWRHVSQEYGVPSYGTGYTTTHLGTDFAYPMGTPILSVFDGTVTYLGNSNVGWGTYIEITGVDGCYLARYAHLSEQLVSEGDYVQMGDVIGLVGSTGNSTGPHLHLEIVEEGIKINPRDVLPDG